MFELLKLEGLKRRIENRLREIDLVLNLKHDTSLSNEYDILSIRLEKINGEILHIETNGYHKHKIDKNIKKNKNVKKDKNIKKAKTVFGLFFDEKNFTLEIKPFGKSEYFEGLKQYDDCCYISCQKRPLQKQAQIMKAEWIEKRKKELRQLRNLKVEVFN